MRPILTDRMAVISVVGGLVLWICCLGVLWGWAYDASGAMALRTTLAIFVACWLCMSRRGWLIRQGRRALVAMRLEHKIPLDDALAERLGSSREDVNKRMTILASAAVLAVACFVFATVWILAAAAIAAMIGQCFLLSDWVWKLIEWVALLAGALPVALGLAGVCFAVKVVRESGGRDIFGAGYRDWLWGVAVGVAGFAVSWWFGANLIYLVFSVAFGILVMAVTAISRVDLATHPRKKLLPFGPPPKRSSAVIASTYAGAMLVLMLQTRLLGDIFSLSLTRRLLWVFLAISLLTYFLGRFARKSKPPSRRQTAGAVIGLAAGLLAQSAEWIFCLGQASGTSVPVALGVATQIPMAALAAMVISYQRRNFAQLGGSAGAYFTAMAGGLAWAVAVFMLLGSISWGWVLLIVLLAGGVIAGGLDGARQASEKPVRIQWLVFSGLLCVAMVVSLGVAIGRAGEVVGTVRPGAWLSAMCDVSRGGRRFSQRGVLPGDKALQSEVVTDCLAGVFERRKGRWWVAASAAGDLPARDRLAGLDEDVDEWSLQNRPSIWTRIYTAGANPQPPSVARRAKRWPPLSYSDPNYFRYARLNFVADIGCDFYDGVFLAPLRADHPQAWRCYNDRILRRCRRLTEGAYLEWVPELGKHVPRQTSGLVALRTQVAPGHVRRALSVARTYYNVVGSGWAVVAFRPGLAGMDMLLLGPDEALAGAGHDDILAFLRETASRSPGRVYLVPIQELWAVYVGVEPIYLFSPPGERLDDTPKLKGLRKYLDKATFRQRN